MTWVVYRGVPYAKVVDYALWVKNGKRYNVPNKIAIDLIKNHQGFTLSKKEKIEVKQ